MDIKIDKEWDEEDFHRFQIEFINISDEPDVVYHFYVDEDLISKFRIKNNLAVPPPRGFHKVRVDPARHHSGQKHIHIYRSANDEYVSINQDGSLHHRNNQKVVLSKDLYQWILKNFPDFDLPPDRVIQFGSMENLVNDLDPIIIIDVNSSWVFDHEAGIKLNLRS